MKFLIPTIMFISILFCTQHVLAQNSIAFFEGSIEEVFLSAKSQNKAIFIEAYTPECSLCQKMQKEVFVHSKVRAFYNNFFVNFKLDISSEEGVAFAKKHDIKASPSYMYFHTEGGLSNAVVGTKNPQEFIEAGRKGALNVNRLKELKVEYEAGNLDKELVAEYLRQLWLENDSAVPAIVKTNNSDILIVNSEIE